MALKEFSPPKRLRENLGFFLVFVFSVLALLISGVFFHYKDSVVNVEKKVERLQEDFLNKEKEASRELQYFIESHKKEGENLFSDPGFLNKMENTFHQKGLVFALVENNNLAFWSQNTVPFSTDDVDHEQPSAMRLPNGWYYLQTIQENSGKYLVLATIKYEYRYQNRFLVNEFHHDLEACHELFYVSDRKDEGFPIINGDGDYAFSLVLRREEGLVSQNNFVVGLSVFFAIGGLLVLVFGGFRFFSKLFFEGRRNLSLWGFPLFMIVLRVLGQTLEIPSIFYSGDLFSPALYATSVILPSLGDLFLNMLFFSIITYFFFYHLKKFPLRPSPKGANKYLYSVGLFALIFLFCKLAVFLIEGLVIDSRLNLNVNFIFNLDIYSLVGFIVIGSIFFSFFFLSVVLCRKAYSLLRDQTGFRLVFLTFFVVVLSVQWAFFTPDLLLWLLFLTALVIFELEKRTHSPKALFSSLLVSLFLFSIISTFALYRFNHMKEMNKRHTYALKLASEQDPVAEYMFLEIEENLFNDNQLKNMVLRDPYNTGAIYRYLQYHYFYDFWGKYDLQITVCRPDEVILLRPSDIEVNCLWFFENYMINYGKTTASEKLIYLDNNTGRTSYITQIPITMGEGEDHLPGYYVFLEFDSKFIPRDMGFPELLIDQEIDINRELFNYSYATYIDGVLVNKFGPYIYSTNAEVYGEFDEEFTSFIFDDHDHLAYQKDEETLIIVSKPKDTFLERIAPFSYLFILFLLLVFIYWLLTSQTKIKSYFRLNFRRRVQYSMIGIVLISVITIGGASAWFIFNIYENKNLSFINEKAHSVLVETEHYLAEEPYLDESLEYYLSDLLVRFSNVFFTDINLYSPEGKLLASSRPRVFEEGLVSNKMNPAAFFQLRHHQKSQFVHTEQIGKLEFLSAYQPLRNHHLDLLGYINLPYFAQQSELRNEISYFLVAFMNIYLLLLLIAIVVALFISNHVTLPLQLIRDSISRVQLGKSNQKIRWTRSDEIGALISEYNRMIDELEVSANLLARSERESAWREMAKQVAHEIKNPLTPMRLSVQYLEKAWKEKVPDWDERLERFCKTMVEQIDNLSVIANEFSDFAQMPAGENNRLDLKTFIVEFNDLYKDFEKVSIDLDIPRGDEPYLVNVDRRQLLRVFNNLVKNAVQSYPRNQKAIVRISCQREGNYYRVEVKDFGCGIPENLKPKIFSPYFTTKTGGMGLGLSMVKSIIENFKGEISFYSQEGLGTSFIFKLPVYEPGIKHLHEKDS